MLSEAAYLVYIEWKHPHTEDSIRAAVHALDAATRAELGKAADAVGKYAAAVSQAVKQAK
jgi:hypothetical protein